MLELNKLILGDCLEKMKDIPDGSVEEWRTVSIDEHYEVSNLGNARRKEYATVYKNGIKRIYKSQPCKLLVGKTCVTVSINGKAFSIAKLVADAFLDSKEKRGIVYHKNGNMLDNRVENLTYSNETILFDKDENLSEKEYISKYYHVSNNGIVTRKCDGRVLKGVVGPKGYIYIRIKSPKFSKNKDRRKNYKIHRLVAMFYLDDYSEDLQVNHKNGIKSDNRAENLEMVTNSQNVYHAWNCLDSTERRRKVSERNKAFGNRTGIQKAAQANRKRVAMLDENRKVIKSFPSLTAAANEMGLHGESAISYAVKHDTKSCNYYWKFL